MCREAGHLSLHGFAAIRGLGRAGISHLSDSVLPDDTPIEVLALYRSNFRGWKYRVRMLPVLSPIETLGDLRKATDDELRKCPTVGVGMVRELRKFCPYRKRARARRN